MQKRRGSATVMAIAAMLVLAVGAASYSYMAVRNVNIAKNYGDGLQAEYTAEAAVVLMHASGRASVDPENGWKPGQPSALEQWAGTDPYAVTIPGLGSAQVTVNALPEGTFRVQATSTASNVSRTVFANNMDIRTDTSQEVAEDTSTVTTAKLITQGQRWVSTSDSRLQWQIPDNVEDTTNPAKSPGYGTANNAWASLTSQVLFNDSLGLASFTATDQLQLLFRVNYYIKLTNVAGSGSGSGYGVYYLARKSQEAATWVPGNPGDPTAYVVQFDPGLNPSYSAPSGGAWGAAFSNPVNTGWPYGAFLVKKAWADGTTGWQDEVWDESGSYQVHYAFQDNNELLQRYYYRDGGTYKLAQDGQLPALQPSIASPASSAPAVTRVPTAFGLNPSGVFGPAMTGKYRSRPPDLRLAYSLGQIAEGNPWQANTYYPAGAKVVAGVWVDNPLAARLVWVATRAGVSGTGKPAKLAASPAEGDTAVDGSVTWTAQKAPSSEQIANYVCANGISIAKISMADLKYRLDSVTGKAAKAEPYNVPFAMVQGTKNKITVELWVDKNGNRVHLIRVNDVLALAFNDRYAAGKHNIVPRDWEISRSVQLGTGIRIWNAAAEFYTAENYGQTVRDVYKINANYGLWGR
ncbi:MAG TPA: hypothetical protein PKA10_07335 [Selenomonadales bacterium]|nr:hypothetical protein [Selenomonadales bacterium]